MDKQEARNQFLQASGNADLFPESHEGTSPDEERKVNRTIVLCLAIFALVALAAFILPNVTLFEDGSWAIGQYPYPLSGCLPWGLCN